MREIFVDGIKRHAYMTTRALMEHNTDEYIYISDCDWSGLPIYMNVNTGKYYVIGKGWSLYE